MGWGPERLDVPALVWQLVLNDAMRPRRHGSPAGMKASPTRSRAQSANIVQASSAPLPQPAALNTALVSLLVQFVDRSAAGDGAWTSPLRHSPVRLPI